MSIYFPSLTSLGRGIVLAAVLAVIGHLVFPTLGLTEPSAALSFTIGLAIGAVVMVLLSSLFAETKVRTTTLYVGNLAFKTNEAALRDLFSGYGQVQSVRIMKDRLTRKPRGFAFVEMERTAARQAAKEMDGREFNGRPLKVNAANRPKQGDE